MPRSIPRHRQQRRSATGDGVSTATVAVFAMTDANTRAAHFVADEDVTAGLAVGRYVAICGRVVIAASLTTPETSYCDPCLYWRAKNHTPPCDPRRNEGGTWWRPTARIW
ncbi:MAG: hypothetical protein ACRDRS_17680 [Pseudonocardiaceae bacterium]